MIVRKTIDVDIKISLKNACRSFPKYDWPKQLHGVSWLKTLSDIL